MRKFCFAFVFAIVVCVGSCFAVSSDDSIDNSLDPAPADSVGGYMLDAVSYAVSSSGWTNTDHDYLNQIRLALTSKNTGTLLNIEQLIIRRANGILNGNNVTKQSTSILRSKSKPNLI